MYLQSVRLSSGLKRSFNSCHWGKLVELPKPGEPVEAPVISEAEVFVPFHSRGEKGQEREKETYTSVILYTVDSSV
ncbi:uncharacterized protein EAE98_000730 [Botrytis deweyae]|uniref:Uncharacterized protein n=1 Tax=Botrytis deweyae TaxID=2478750 RepID=A0ABQ7IZM8_9HELO|nr:uncharacterized protein EAE98_000730 [Botrytis deweyae]KAF7938392.1 hypothetical protein EAE98_000730 [Botrytis deweyae]